MVLRRVAGWHIVRLLMRQTTSREPRRAVSVDIDGSDERMQFMLRLAMSDMP